MVLFCIVYASLGVSVYVAGSQNYLKGLFRLQQGKKFPSLFCTWGSIRLTLSFWMAEIWDQDCLFPQCFHSLHHKYILINTQNIPHRMNPNLIMIVAGFYQSLTVNIQFYKFSFPCKTRIHVDAFLRSWELFKTKVILRVRKQLVLQLPNDFGITLCMMEWRKKWR